MLHENLCLPTSPGFSSIFSWKITSMTKETRKLGEKMSNTDANQLYSVQSTSDLGQADQLIPLVLAGSSTEYCMQVVSDLRALWRPCCTYQPPMSSWAAKFRAAGAKYPAVLQYDWPPTSGLLGSISLLHDWKYFDRLTIRTQAAILPGLFPITFGSFPLAQTSCSGVVLFLVISVRFITTFIIYYYTVYIFFSFFRGLYSFMMGFL